MILNAFFGPEWLLWPEGLMVVLAMIYLGSGRALPSNRWSGSIYERLLLLVGFLVTGGTVLLGSMPSYYTIIAIPIIPAPFVFLFLIFRPALMSRWNKMRIYLTACVALSAFAWGTQLIWLLTR